MTKMYKKLQRGLLALILVGGIALAFVYREQIDARILEDWVAGAGVAVITISTTSPSTTCVTITVSTMVSGAQAASSMLMMTMKPSR